MATAVYLEVGSKKTFACTLDWPGWCRSAKTEDGALEALAEYAERYAPVAETAGVRFPKPERSSFDVVERLEGTVTTDFGAPDIPAAADREPLTKDTTVRTYVWARQGGSQMADVKPIPDDLPRVIPYLCIDGASAAIDFYHSVFDAKERMRMADPEGKVLHAELDIGDAVIMLSDEFPDMGSVAPTTIGGTPVTLMVYVEDVDSVYDKAVSAGASAERPVENQFYGDRAGAFQDPFGHKWYVATHVEDVSPEEMELRSAEAMGGGSS